MSTTTPSDFRDLQIDLLQRAIGIYLEIAYAGEPPPESVKRRLAWDPGIDATTLLNRPPFERASKAREGVTPIRSLRLGNARYPHMKLQIQPWPIPAGFLLSVNTHDQVQLIEPDSPEAEKFRTLQTENQTIKEAIEAAWDAAGLPTFHRYLRDYIVANPTVSPDSAESGPA